MGTTDTGGHYLVWSNEHRAWWRPSSNGYTASIQEAGRYTREEAIAIARGRGGWRRGRSIPNEVAMREDDALAMEAGRW